MTPGAGPQSGPADPTGRDKFARHRRSLEALSALLRCARPAAHYLLNNCHGTGSLSIGLRYCALRALAAECGSNVYLDAFVRIKEVGRLKVGSNVSIHSFCYIDAAGGVAIGNDVSIAHGSSILSTEHDWSDASLPIKYNPLRHRETRIGDDVWIGSGVRVLAGTQVSERCVLAAGAVVKGILDPAAIYGGVPARKLKTMAERLPPS